MAALERRILMTMDKDFGQLIFVGKTPHCGLVRLPDVPAARRIELMERLLRDHTKKLADGAIQCRAARPVSLAKKRPPVFTGRWRWAVGEEAGSLLPAARWSWTARSTRPSWATGSRRTSPPRAGRRA